MKTITVERNFRISNDDPYLKEKLFLTREVPDEVDEDKTMNVLREKLNANFKAAYPHVRTYLNFEEVIQVAKLPQEQIDYVQDTIKAASFSPSNSDEKINKGTIEEQIEACTTLDELKSFELIAKMNPKLVELWGNKSKKLLVHI